MKTFSIGLLVAGVSFAAGLLWPGWGRLTLLIILAIAAVVVLVMSEMEHRENGRNHFRDVTKMVAPLGYEDATGWHPGTPGEANAEIRNQAMAEMFRRELEAYRALPEEEIIPMPRAEDSHGTSVKGRWI